MSPVPSYVEAGAGREAILFLHGIGGGAESFRPQLDFFAPHFRTIAWNMPGYGGSPLAAAMSFPGLAAAVTSLLDALALPRAHLVGHSIGGMVAQEVAIGHPGRLASLTLYATSPAFGKPDGEWQRRFLAARLAPLEEGRSMAELATAVVGGLVGPGAEPAGRAAAIACMAAVPPESYRCALTCLFAFDRRDALPRIAVPTLLIAGERDPNAPVAVMERMADKIPGASLAVIPGAGHLANLERPATFNAVLGEFLSGLSERSDAHGRHSPSEPPRAH